MKETKPARPVDKSGRIVLPPEVGKAMEWNEKTPAEIWLNAAEDEVVIKKRTFNCAFCGAAMYLKAFNRKYICPDCQKEISGL